MCVLTEDECVILHKLAERTSLYLSRSEEIEICDRITSIKRFFSQLDEVNVEDLKPLYHVLEVSGKTREDNPEPFPAEEIRRSLKGRFRDDYVVAPWKGGYD
ncbi:MAG: aspartyl/glutamyl-tRNA amidotransferase subunit C [Desulfurococcales archaeon]|nr:aspartyl/glutamyl-tRNA amidotransferase subunit C [Desulfurococcales archaeon]